MKHSSRHHGFTLTEIMISIAMALILILGINQVFRVAAETISTGAGQSDVMRSQRSAFSTMRTDFEGYTSDPSTGMVPLTQMPFLVIHNEKRNAFFDLADQQADPDGVAATIDLDGNGAEGEVAVLGEDVASGSADQYIYNRRNHRIDTLAFFSTGLFRRQTGQLTPVGYPGAGTETFVSNMESDQAYIWYGHLKLPDAGGTYYEPGDANPANVDNMFARSFTLGRVCLLMKERRGHTTTNLLVDNSGIPQIFAEQDRNPGGQPFNPFTQASLWVIDPSLMMPYGFLTSATHSSGGNRAFYDIADAELGAYRTMVQTWDDAGGPPAWWQYPLQIDPNDAPAAAQIIRFEADPVVPKPANSGTASMTVPIFMRSCTQFFVEFAGDFVTQATPGSSAVTAQAPEGVTDFVIRNVDPDGAGPLPTSAIREIQWYGLARDVDGDGDINDDDATVDGPADVVPVQVFAGAVHAFERNLQPDRYTCVFGPQEFDGEAGVYPPGGVGQERRPSLIRITIQVVDKNGRVPDGLSQEYVFKVRGAP